MVSRRARFERRIIRIFVHTILSFFFLLHCSAKDNITFSSSLSDGQTLVLASQRFELGFFSPTPTDSSNTEAKDIRRYVGIWYHKSNPRIIVWVSNRDSPLRSYNRVLAIDVNGNLVLSDDYGDVWNTKFLGSSSRPRMAKLMDSGNLVLNEVDDGAAMSVWESFKTPTDTFLAGMKMDENRSLTSWTSEGDPRPGSFTFKMDRGENQYQILKQYIPYWRSAESTDVCNWDQIIPGQIIYLLTNFNVNPSSPSIDYSRSRLVMNFTGEIQYWTEDEVKGWSLNWAKPRYNCSLLHYCGNFGICTYSEPQCKCLPGLAPTSPENWNVGDFTGGCRLKTPAPCHGNDTFFRFKEMKVTNPEVKLQDQNAAGCLNECRSTCKCQAYSYGEPDPDSRRRRDDTTGNRDCWIWTGPLNNLQEYVSDCSRDLYVRVAASAGNKTEGGSIQQVEAINGRKKQPWTLIFRSHYC